MQGKRALVALRRAYPRTFPEWGIRVTYAMGEDGHVYVPVRQVCEALGVHVGAQLEKLNAAPDYQQALVDIPLTTAGGVQRVACLRKREAAWWLINLDDAHCRVDIRDALQDIKQRLIDAAEALLFGDIVIEPPAHRGLITSASHTEIVMACLTCGATHRISTINGEVTIALEREKGA